MTKLSLLKDLIFFKKILIHWISFQYLSDILGKRTIGKYDLSCHLIQTAASLCLILDPALIILDKYFTIIVLRLNQRVFDFFLGLRGQIMIFAVKLHIITILRSQRALGHIIPAHTLDLTAHLPTISAAKFCHHLTRLHYGKDRHNKTCRCIPSASCRFLPHHGSASCVRHQYDVWQNFFLQCFLGNAVIRIRKNNFVIKQ